MKKKILGIVLAVLMISVLIPMAAFADNGNFYNTFAAANSGDVISLDADVVNQFVSDYTGKSLTVDLCGHTITTTGDTVFQAEGNSTLTIVDSVGGGKIIGPAACVWVAGENNVINIAGGTLKDTSGLGVVVSEGNGTKINVTGGTLEGADAPNTATFGGMGYSHSCACIETYEIATVSYVEGSLVTKYPGATAVEAAQGSDIEVTDPVVPEEPAVAMIGEVEYKSLDAAVAALKDGDTLTLVADCCGSIEVANKAITLDLNGKTLSCADGSALNLGGNASLTIVGDGKVESPVCVFMTDANNELYLNGGTLKDTGTAGVVVFDQTVDNYIEVNGATLINGVDESLVVVSDILSHVFSDYGGTNTNLVINFKSGDIDSGDFDAFYFTETEADVEISGGSFTKAAPEEYLAKGIEAVVDEEGNIVYTETLSAAQEKALADLDELVLTYTTDAAKAVIAEAKAAVGTAGSRTEVEAIVEQAKTDADAAEAAAIAAAELAAAKEDAVAELEAYVATLGIEDDSFAAAEIDKINAAADKAAVDAALAEAKAAADTQKAAEVAAAELAAAKAAAVAELEAYVATLGIEDDSFAAAEIANINAAADKAAVAAALQAAKAAAVATFKAYVASLKLNDTSFAAERIDAINNAANKAKVAEELAAAKAAAEAQKAAEEAAAAKALRDAKDAAIAELKAVVGSSTDKDVQAMLASYIEQIEKATSISAVNSIVPGATSALKQQLEIAGEGWLVSSIRSFVNWTERGDQAQVNKVMGIIKPILGFFGIH